MQKDIIIRTLLPEIRKSMFLSDVIILVWPRQVGKTTLIEKVLEGIPSDMIIRYNGDYIADRRDLQFRSRQEMDLVFSRYTYIVIDEAQKIENIGNILKSLRDAYGEQKQILVTGSSTLGLLDQTTEPLTGRKKIFHLYPIAFCELEDTFWLRDARTRLEETLLYGMYPQVLSYRDTTAKKEKLQDIVSGQLYRDILEFQAVKNPDIQVKLLELLALRIGSEISYHAIAQLLSVSQQTVERYIDLLEKSFIIFRLRPYMTNKLKEVTKMKKIYFYDLGIRNALLRSFQPISLRTDRGALWENYYILERRKNLSYTRALVNQYFWRTKAQEEIDYLEVSDHIIWAYECKWQDQRYHPPKAFTWAYPWVPIELIHHENYYLSLIW